MRLVHHQEVVVQVQQRLVEGDRRLHGGVAVVPKELVGAQRRRRVDLQPANAAHLAGGEAARKSGSVHMAKARQDVVLDGGPLPAEGEVQPGRVDPVAHGEGEQNHIPSLPRARRGAALSGLWPGIMSA